MSESRPVSSDEYYKNFSGKKRERALAQAMDVRKFEISLYWQRTAYFWTFIAAAFAGFGVIQSSEVPMKEDLSLMVACVGFVLSFAWYFANRGSKVWQENWENHVDLLENKVHGPLYKTVLKRPKIGDSKISLLELIVGPSPHSVSKINQIVSLYILVQWLFVIWYALPPISIGADIRWDHVGIVGLAALACAAIAFGAKTNEGEHFPRATMRSSRISGETASQDSGNDNVPGD